MTPYWTDRSKITVKTDLVLELVDNFTNQLIRPCHLRFFINERPAKTTRNKNGLMVFCNLLDTPKKIRIECDLYQSTEIRLSEDEMNQHLEGKYVHKLLRLEPSKRYSIPKWATVIEGTLKQSADINFDEISVETIISEVTDTFRIKKESADKSHAAIHMTNNDIMIGRQFYDSKAHPSDSFFITESNEEDFVIRPAMNQPLEAHTLLQEIKTVHVQKNGHFMMVYPNVSGEMPSIKIYMHKQKIAEVQIQAGKWNDLGVLST